MATQTPAEYLEGIYDRAMELVAISKGGKEITSDLSKKEMAYLDVIIKHSEKARGLVAVLTTSIVYKALHPQQDIRNHQASIKKGYAGRVFDTKNITPFLKKKKFPAPKGTGWLTRAFEQKSPYTKSYKAAINTKEAKVPFLELIDLVQKGADCEKYISYLFQGFIIKRNSQVIDLSKPANLSINTILTILENHFNTKYKAEGASRLPTLAIYAAYICLFKEIQRFNGKALLPLESHTASDRSSGTIGDINIVDSEGKFYEGVEVKLGIPISLQMIEDARDKFEVTPASRYYILSTAEVLDVEKIEIDEEIQRIKNVHGCQLIVNGIIPTLKYYLRLLENPYEFIENYVLLLENDQALKFEHKERWNKIIGELK